MPGELFTPDIIYTHQPSRQLRDIWECELNSSQRTYEFEVEDDHYIHLLSLWTISLGNTANEIHVIAVKNEQTQDEPVTIATLKAPHLLLLNLHGLDITLPTTILLTSGSGPVFITGQHFTVEGIHEENGHSSVL